MTQHLQDLILYNSTYGNYRYYRDTTGSTHYHVRQYLSEIFQPLTINDYNIKDSFDAVNRLKTFQNNFLSPHSQIFLYRDL